MSTEESRESHDRQGAEGVSSSAVDWRRQFFKSFKDEYRGLISQLPQDETPAQIEGAAMISLGRVLADLDADSESIVLLLEEIAKRGKLVIRQADLARILSNATAQSHGALRLADNIQAVPWEYLLDETKPTNEREAALCFCAERDEDRAAAFLADELARDDIPNEWQDALVLCAETVQLHEDAVRHRLWSRLLKIASHRRRDPDDTASKPAVFSAIRCLTSMIPVEELSRLLPLLEPPAPLETRLVTLQCIVNVFEAGPPTSPDQLVQLRDRIHELAIKFLDRDWLIAGERAAIALNAIQALASLGDERLTTCVSQVLGLRMDWFTRQLIRKLEEITDAWAAIKDCQPLRLVREQLVLLQEGPASTN